jgi:hypothetical protein
MKLVPKMPIPWDMVVFLSITSVGFGFSVNRLMNNPSIAQSPSREVASVASTASASDVQSTNQHLVDLGCLERRLGGEKWSTSKDTIRLRGRFCNLSRRAMRVFQGVRVVNLTNGFKGTAFLQARDPAFVTDDVVLKKGKNLIQIEWRETLDGATRIWTAEVTGD